jgi:hypothetical protein
MPCLVLAAAPSALLYWFIIVDLPLVGGSRWGTLVFIPGKGGVLLPCVSLCVMCARRVRLGKRTCLPAFFACLPVFFFFFFFFSFFACSLNQTAVHFQLHHHLYPPLHRQSPPPLAPSPNPPSAMVDTVTVCTAWERQECGMGLAWAWYEYVVGVGAALQ